MVQQTNELKNIHSIITNQCDYNSPKMEVVTTELILPLVQKFRK